MYCWSSSESVGNEFEKLFNRMNPPRVTVDNASDKRATLIKVHSANKSGSLLEVVQVFTDMNLMVTRAYISSDGGWFMDVFHVTDEFGNKVEDDTIPERIQQSLGRSSRTISSLERSVGVESAAEHTTIELSSTDRPGLLSEVFSVLTNHNCNVVAAEVWTHNSRMASIIYITDASNGLAIDDPDRLNHIKRLLLLLHTSSVSIGSTSYAQRRLHQMMYADRDYDGRGFDRMTGGRRKPTVTVEKCAEKEYTMVNLRSVDRPNLMFDTVCAITDMQYVIYHGSVVCGGAEAQQEYYIRHMNGCPITSEAEGRRFIHCMEAAIMRRSSEGVRLELCSKDEVGLLSNVTRIFRENGLSVRRAEVTTRGMQAVNVFYVLDASGYPVNSETIESVRKEIGFSVLRVKDDACSASPSEQQTCWFSLSRIFQTRFG